MRGRIKRSAVPVKGGHESAPGFSEYGKKSRRPYDSGSAELFQRKKILISRDEVIGIPRNSGVEQEIIIGIPADTNPLFTCHEVASESEEGGDVFEVLRDRSIFRPDLGMAEDGGDLIDELGGKDGRESPFAKAPPKDPGRALRPN